MSNQNYLEIIVPIRLDTKWHQSLVKDLAAVSKNIDWQRKGIHHQTLVFIKDGSQVNQLKTEFKKMQDKFKPITLTLDKLEAFSTVNGDKYVVCLTSSQPSKKLLELANEVRACAECVGANYDKRPFKLHVTLCKIPSDEVSLEEVKSILAKIQFPEFVCCLRDIQYRYMGGRRIY